MKRGIRISAAIGAVLLAIAFLAPLVGMAIRNGRQPVGYWATFRSLAPLTYTAFIMGVLALCAAVMLWLVRDWARTR